MFGRKNFGWNEKKRQVILNNKTVRNICKLRKCTEISKILRVTGINMIRAEYNNSRYLACSPIKFNCMARFFMASNEITVEAG